MGNRKNEDQRGSESDLSDRSLDQLLGNVQVPSDLHQRLLEITNQPEGLPEEITPFRLVDQAIDAPHSHPTGSVRQVSSPAKAQWKHPMIVTAASVALLIASLIFFGNQSEMFGSPFDTTARNREPAKTFQPKQPNTDARIDLVLMKLPESAIELDRLVKNQQELLEQMDLALAELELQQLEAKLASLENASNWVEPHEQQSVILALADQAGHVLGNSSDQIAKDMEFVKQQYPGTRGAEMAAKFLASVDIPIEN